MSTNLEHNSAFASTADTAGKTYMLRYLPNFIVGFNSVAVVLNSWATVMGAFHYDEASNATRPFIVIMHLPFEINKHSVYLTIVLLQFSCMLILSAGAATVNSVLIILVLHLDGQIDIICRLLTDIPQGQKDHIANVTLLKEIIRKHQRAIAFSENIESLYSYIALALGTINTLVTCGLGFILVISVGSPNFTKMVIKNLMFYCVLNIETFVLCFAGEYLTVKSREIGEAAYNSPWYKSKFHGRTILFIIMRSQKQLTITMGKFMDLSLEQFANIVKASASYMSVLLAVY